MKITIDIDIEGTRARVTVMRRPWTGHSDMTTESLLTCSLDTRTGEEVAGLVAKTVGVAVADAIAGGG